jgi:hypothetical protein
MTLSTETWQGMPCDLQILLMPAIIGSGPQA